MSIGSGPRALIFEEHSSVLPHWWSEGAGPRTLVYLDAHLDLQYVNSERIRRLEQCTSAQQMAALEKPHDLCPDGEFGYSLENFLYPATRLGLIGKLIWVLPPHVRTGYSDKVATQLEQMDGVLPEELMSFRRVDGRIEGRLLGLDLTLCDFRQLERLALPADSRIDIDVDYFIAVPGDRPWVDPQEVFGVLRRLRLTTESITLSRSVSSGFTPLRHRFIADYLAALWEERADDADHYARVFDLDRRLEAGEREAVAQAMRAETERRPDCAAGWHLLGLAQADPAQAASCHARAAEISPAYGPSVLRAACEIRHRRLGADLAGVMRLGRELHKAPAAEQGLAFAALGLLLCGFGDLKGALECYRRASQTLGSQSELAMQIAKLLMRAGRPDEAVRFLAIALEDDKARSAAHSYLGHIFRRLGQLERARAHLEQAHEAAPCWGGPLETLVQLYRDLGEPALAQGCAQRLAALRAQQASLSRGFAGDP